MTNPLLYGPNQVAEFPQAGPQFANDVDPKNYLGRVIQYAGKKYRYVQVVTGSDVTPLAGGAVYWKQLEPENGIFIVSTDYSDSLAGANGVAGVLEEDVVEDEHYTWIQVGGVVEECLVVSGTAVGGQMKGYASADLTLDKTDAGTASVNNVIGIAHTARNGTTGTARVLLQNLEW